MKESTGGDALAAAHSLAGAAAEAASGPDLTEGEFVAAVRGALKHYHRPDRLRDTPLARSRLVAAELAQAAAPLSRTQALKNVLEAHCRRLRQTPKLGEMERVLSLTYLAPLRSQQAVAEALHLSWSTYRRRLANAVQALAAQLWEAETALAQTSAEAGNTASVRPAARPNGKRGVLAAAAVMIMAGATLWWLLASSPSARTTAAPQAAKVASPSSRSQEAHDFYLVGLKFLNLRTAADIERSIRYFRRAIAADPDYASAWSGIATAYTVMRDYNGDALPDTYYIDALAAASKAAALDPKLSRPHAVLGYLHAEHWEWHAAAHELRLALSLDPNDATAHQWYAMYLWATGDMQAALAQMRIASSLDPLSSVIAVDLGAALQYAGQTDAAIAQFQAVIARRPNFALPHLYLADAYRVKGRYPAALAAIEKAAELAPNPRPAVYVALLGNAYARAGNRAMAQRQLDELLKRAQNHYVSDVLLAELYSALGNDQAAFRHLAHGVAEHDHQMLWVLVEPGEWLNDARYKAILARMHLPLGDSPAVARQH